MALEPGLNATVSKTVGPADTAVSHGSGEVDVWATPSVVALCEAAAVAVLSGQLEQGETSVGTHISLDHLAPTPVGRKVSATATLEAVDGRTLTFVVEASEGEQVLARGNHTRIRVGRARFMERALGDD